MKLLIMPSNISEIENTLPYCDAYLIGIEGLSVNTSLCVTIDELYEIKDIIGNKELFINLNKNMCNSDIEFLKNVMMKLNDFDIKGVFYYDVAVINIYSDSKENYNYSLVWASEHASTNYGTINFWKKFGAEYCLISSDITSNEIVTISKNTDCKLIVSIFGYQPMFNSKRHLVMNYLEYFKLNNKIDKINYLEHENKIYPIVDNDIGTEVYTDYILNGFGEYKSFVKSNISYLLLNSFNIDFKLFLNVLKELNDLGEDNYLDKFEIINKMFLNTNDGFLNKETIMRVKNESK